MRQPKDDHEMPNEADLMHLAQVLARLTDQVLGLIMVAHHEGHHSPESAWDIVNEVYVELQAEAFELAKSGMVQGG